MKKDFKTAVIYARYSCDAQNEQSIEGQLHVCQEYAKKNNIVILDTYIDRAMTGTNDNRAGFQKMIKDSARKEWDYVLVYKLDRFSRDKYATAIHKKTLRDNGVKLVSAMENIPDSPEGIILESVLEGLNQYYSMELSQKVLRGMKETRRKGFWQGGTLPYGYKVENRKVIIIPEEAEVIKYIYRQYFAGICVKDIIEDLTTKGLLHKGEKFALSTVYAILKNEKYTGKYMLRDELVDNIYPKIISDELFQKVRKINESNKHGRNCVTTTYLLRNKLKCGYCGSLVGAECCVKNKEYSYYYKCRNKKANKKNCNLATFRKSDLENIIIKSIINELKKPNTLEKIISHLVKLQEELTKTSPQLNMLIKEQKEIEKSINNLLSAIESGVVTNTTTNRLKDLETKLAEIEKELSAERNKIAIKVPEDSIREYFAKGLKLEPTFIISYFVDEILLYDDKAIIKFNTPLNLSPDESQGCDICTKQTIRQKYSRNGDKNGIVVFNIFFMI